MHVYVELVEKDEEHDSYNDSDSDSESENEIVDEKDVVYEVEVNMNNFKFQTDEEDESLKNDAIVPNVNVTEDNLEVLDFDSLESDLEDVPENATSLGLKKLKKKHSSSKFFIGREFANRDLAKDLIRDHDVEIMDISGKGKIVNEDAEEDKSGCPWDYVCELKRCNPYTTVKIDVYGVEDPEMPTRMFRRIYVCLGALKRGFREGGKELFALDGAFMKGQYPGQMLTAVGMDANNGIYPVAYGIVESEKQYSWNWLLKCLGDDFDLYNNFNFTFITDWQKGLLLALAKLFPSAEHRARCDLLINNVCEVFNRQLLDARDSPIITALEFMREYLMKRIVIVQKVIQKCDGLLTPAVAKLFDKIKAASTGYTVEWNSSELYQVKGSHPEHYVVKLTQKTCSCMKWGISGIPCKHAIAAIHDMTDNGYDVGILKY
nr:hypothetical protein [Tanacetum cinerariifolium]